MVNQILGDGTQCRSRGDVAGGSAEATKRQRRRHRSRLGHREQQSPFGRVEVVRQLAGAGSALAGESVCSLVATQRASRCPPRTPAYSKHRREDVLPLHPDLAARLSQWLSERDRQADDQQAVLSFDRAVDAKSQRLFPGTGTARAAEILRADLDAAGVPYLTDAGIADFHSLRHTFVSNLAAAGVHPKVAQQLARHSTITLTMDRYSHLGLFDMTAGLSALPTIATSDANEHRATGTTATTPINSNLSCTKSCNASAGITPSQPFSPVSGTVENSLPETTKNLAFQRENTRFDDEKNEWDRWDSNPEPTDYESAALTD